MPDSHVVATKWFPNNTSDNVRHSAVKSLYAECFAVYYRDRHLKETSQNRLLLTSEKSLTIKQPRSLPNNSDGIFSVSVSVQFSIALRSVLVRFSFGSRSFFDRFSFGSRSFFDRFSIDSRSSFVHPPFILRSGIEDWSKNERRIIGGKTEMYRNSNGKPRERRFEQKLYFKSLKFKLLWQDLPLTLSLFCIIT